jgi:hypothetical protein
MRKSNLYFITLSAQVILLISTFLHAKLDGELRRQTREQMSIMVHQFSLTDLCLFSEASYTRHLSQADTHTPFQDNPFSMDHFPSGSLIELPAENFQKAWLILKGKEAHVSMD